MLHHSFPGRWINWHLFKVGLCIFGTCSPFCVHLYWWYARSGFTKLHSSQHLIFEYVVQLFRLYKNRSNGALLLCFQQTLCSEMGEELRFAVRCFNSSSKPVHRKPSYDVTDNGLQSMPLNSYKNNGRNDMYN